METYEHAKRRFFEFFSKSEPIEDLTKSRMMQWKESLRESLAEATVAGTLTRAKSVFKWAVDIGLLDESPLKGIGRGSFVNREKDHVVTLKEYERYLTACVNQEWRVILAFIRIGGLRPSEVFGMKWSNINWNKKCFYVRSSKTEYQGKSGRWIPLFRQLRNELEELQRQNGQESEFVINGFPKREKTCLVTPFNRMAQKANLPQIERPFDNMRMSRSNELYRKKGSFKEQEWLGHSRQVRDDHYLMMDDSDYLEAAEDDYSDEE